MLPDLLRHETRLHHAALERHNGLPATRSDYLAQLAAFYGFIEPWERRLAAVLPVTDVLVAGRTKTPWLEEDLAHFGFGEPARAALPRCAETPATDSRLQIVGAAYVLEGATLGGQILAAHIERTLGLPAGAGSRFFRSYGSEVRARWEAFRVELQRVSSPAADPVVVGAARETFRSLQTWFAQQMPAAA